MTTLVIQSQSPLQLPAWQVECMASVSRWATLIGAEYRFIGDELFELLPAWVLPHVRTQRVIATDLARLRLMQQQLVSVYDCVVWLDADVLVFAPEHFTLPEGAHAIGREVWVQHAGTRLRSYRKVHNAYLLSRRGDSLLPYYADTAARLLQRAQPPLVPQFLGPKLLTALHNISALNVDERVGMLSPLAMAGLLGGDDAALQMTLAGHGAPVHALNLSASCCGRDIDGVCHDAGAYASAIRQLQMCGPLAGAAGNDGYCKEPMATRRGSQA